MKPTNFNFESFSQQLRMLIVVKNLSLTDAGKQIGLSKATLSRLTRMINLPDVETYIACCKWMGADMESFINAPKIGKVSFSKYCIGQPHCECSRCLTKKGQTPTEFTELKSAVESFHQRCMMSFRTANVLDKTDKKRLVSGLQAVEQLIDNLQKVV